MLPSFTLLFAGVIVLSVLYLFRTKGKGTGKPLPGPSVLESMQVFLKGAIRNTLRLDIAKYADKYGPIMQFRLLLMNVVIVNDVDMFKRICVEQPAGKLSNDRPPTFLYRYLHNESLIFENNTPKHVHKRKVFHGLLKFYGEGVGKFESLMTDTLQDLSDSLRKKSEVEVSTMFRDYISSIIIVLMAGVKPSEIKDSIKKIRNWARSGDELILFENEMYLLNFPFLRFIPGLRFKALCETLTKCRKEFVDTFVKPAKMCQKADGISGKGIIHQLLEERKNPSSKFELSDDDVDAISLDIVGGAYLTTSSSLCLIFLQLAKRPDIQKKIHDEVIRVIGDAKPSFDHKKDMHYTEAVILETLRYVSHFPLLLHCIREDFEFDGYHMPQGSTLMINSWYNHHKASIWGDPWVFRPERFLDECGEILDPTHPIRLKSVPFGHGPRKCPGESFARSRLFLIVSTLVKEFEVLPAKGGQLPSSDPREWEALLVLQPEEFKCQFVPRK